MINTLYSQCGGSSAGQSNGFLNRFLSSKAVLVATFFAFFGNLAIADEIRLSAVANAAIDTELAKRPGAKPAVIADTGSMRPAMSPDCVAIVAPKKYEDVAVGDIAVFTDGVLVCSHRVVKKYNSGYETKGDALRHSDSHLMKRHGYLGYVVVAMVDKQTGRVTPL